jgi:hypothetical protein
MSPVIEVAEALEVVDRLKGVLNRPIAGTPTPAVAGSWADDGQPRFAPCGDVH